MPSGAVSHCGRIDPRWIAAGVGVGRDGSRRRRAGLARLACRRYRAGRRIGADLGCAQLIEHDLILSQLLGRLVDRLPGPFGIGPREPPGKFESEDGRDPASGAEFPHCP